jgi:hypothetical protein
VVEVPPAEDADAVEVEGQPVPAGIFQQSLGAGHRRQ